MTRTHPAALLLLGACAGKQVDPTPDWNSTPQLPSPRAGSYARVPATPADPVVAALAAGHRWDESLSGAAAGLALAAVRGEGSLEEWLIREAAWQEIGRAHV